MTRVLRLSRLSPLLILAAALVALAVFFVNYNAPPASADHGRTRDVWSATLTLQQLTNAVGCDSTSPTVAKKCSTATTLTDDEFTYLGIDYTLTSVTHDGSTWALLFDRSPPEAFKRLTLFVDSVPVSLADATIFPVTQLLRPSAVAQASVAAPSVGNTVQLKLTGPYWTGVDLYNGDADDDLVHIQQGADKGAQYMDITKTTNGTFKVRLDQAPTATVTITIGKLSTGFGIDDFDAFTVSPETLTFTTSNWQTGKGVTVSAAPGAAVGDSIIIAAAVSINTTDTNDPYRSPERRNGFVVTVKTGGL